MAANRILPSCLGLTQVLRILIYHLIIRPLNYLNLGVAAAGSSKYEGWVKIKILRQQTGAKTVPVSISLVFPGQCSIQRKTPIKSLPAINLLL